MAPVHLTSLPEEILLRIVGALDTDPPSVRRARHEPSKHLVDADTETGTPLRNLSSTCRKLRRIALPALFRCARFDLVKEWVLAKQRVLTWQGIGSHGGKAPDGPTILGDEVERSFLEFVKASSLEKRIESFLIFVDEDVEPGQNTDPSHRYQFLELQQDTELYGGKVPGYDSSHGTWNIARDSRIAPSSLFRVRHWATVGYNEGSFLSAYGTYDFFEHGAPTSIQSLLNVLFPATPGAMKLRPGDKYTSHGLFRIKNFSYTAIFPSRTTLQVAPSKQDQWILDDPQRVGKAVLSDCWAAVHRAYSNIATRLLTNIMTNLTGAPPAVETFECEDYEIEAYRPELQSAFGVLDPDDLESTWQIEGKMWRKIPERQKIEGPVDVDHFSLLLEGLNA
ncbi:hypothetical protein H2203_008133 [Taxawa tesnikishii (nom. ined.)]|nr:hypothetical protein H2203_008133 [Dothideales sp. JES 119]